MPRAWFRFYAELNEFLTPERSGRTFEYAFLDRAPVKDRIESFGVPHTEVDLILANGESVDFSYVVEDGDFISVYPMFEAIDIRPVLRVRPEPLRETRFVLDAHLGRLAAFLRMLGFDTLYGNHVSDEELARISRDEHRILLTRDVGLLKRGMVTHGYFVRETDTKRQLAEVVRKFDLQGSIAPFERCMRCNALLREATAEAVADRIPSHARERYREFNECPACGRVYWKGSHYDRMRKLIEFAAAGPRGRRE
jgi:uncharacterized protein with PIN domain